MASQYDGIQENITLPSSISIASSLFTSPIVIVTATPHGLLPGASVNVTGHLGNTKANGRWAEIGVVSPTSFTLVGSSANAAGGATGQVQPLNFGSTMAIPSDGDPDAGATFDVGYEALADRSVMQLFMTGAYKLVASEILGTSIAGTVAGSHVGDTIPPVTWATNHGSGSGLAQMYDASSDPISWIIGGLNSGDLLEINLEGTGQLFGTTVGDYDCSFAIGHQFTPYISSGSLVAVLASPVFGASKLMSSQGNSERSFSPIHLRTLVNVLPFSDGSLGGMCYIAPFCNVAGSSSATGRLIGDYYFWYRIWRRTFLPQ